MPLRWSLDIGWTGYYKYVAPTVLELECPPVAGRTTLIFVRLWLRLFGRHTIMTPTKFAIAMIAGMIWFLCMLSGLFTAAGIAVYIWGGGENGSFSTLQDKTHLAHWAFIVLIAPCILLNAAGGFAAILLPVYCIFHIPMRRKGRPEGFLEPYVKAVNKMLQDEW
jgi:hypothetical protein